MKKIRWQGKLYTVKEIRALLDGLHTVNSNLRADNARLNTALAAKEKQDEIQRLKNERMSANSQCLQALATAMNYISNPNR